MNIRSLIPGAARTGDMTTSGNPFTALQREMNRMFDDAFRGVPGWFDTPAGGDWRLAVDVKETDKAIEVRADLPGVEEKDIDVTLADGRLTIKAEKKTETDKKEGGYHLMERSAGSFFRSLALPFAVEADKVTAVFDKGVLTLTLPKPPGVAAATKKIPIKGRA